MFQSDVTLAVFYFKSKNCLENIKQVTHVKESFNCLQHKGYVPFHFTQRCFILSD